MKFDPYYLFSTKYASWIGIALSVFFASLIIIECFSLKFTLPIRTSLAKPFIQTKQDSFNIILISSLFGTYRANEMNTGPIKKTQLNLTLVGILFTPVSGESQVIIRSEDGEERMYRAGDKLPDGAVIKNILTNSMLIEQNGSLEKLNLPRDELRFEPIAKPLTGE